MLTLDLIINPIVLAVAVLAGIFTGYLFRIRKVAKLKRKILQLEDEMMASHAEILEMQKAHVRTEAERKGQSIPVISMKLEGKDNPKGKASK